MACLEGLPKESLFDIKKHGSTVKLSQSCIWTNHKTSRAMYFEQMRPKWRCLAIMHSSTLGENLKSISAQTAHIRSHTCWWRAGDLCSHRIWALHLIESTMNSSVHQSVLESNVMPSDPTAKAWPRLGDADATAQGSQAHQLIYNRTAGKKRSTS